MDAKMHKWEIEGIGTAPFRLVGVVALPSLSVAEKNPDAYNAELKYACSTAPGIGICRVCGMPIIHNFIIEDANGKRFPVGCECVTKKSDDKMLITEIEAEKRRIAREARQVKAQAKREAKLQEQREKNGGLTNWELAEKKQQEREAARLELGKKFAEYASILERTGGHFCMSVASDLRHGWLPKGRGFDIMVDILAKTEGRRGSKLYNEAYDLICKDLDRIQNS